MRTYENHSQIEDEQKEISTNKMEKIHHFVNLVKEMRNDGFCSKGRTFHTCFALSRNGWKVMEMGWNDYGRSVGKFRRLGGYEFFEDNGKFKYSPNLHAEASTILRLGNMNNSEYDFLNVRIDKNGSCCISRPCQCCFKMLKNFGFHRFYWFEDGLWRCI